MSATPLPWIAASLALLGLSLYAADVPAAAAQTRLAVVIANFKCANVVELKNSAQDGQLLGFDVETFRDLNDERLRECVHHGQPPERRQYSRRLRVR
jgi:hypothetical protein